MAGHAHAVGDGAVENLCEIARELPGLTFEVRLPKAQRTTRRTMARHAISLEKLPALACC